MQYDYDQGQALNNPSNLVATPPTILSTTQNDLRRVFERLSLLLKRQQRLVDTLFGAQLCCEEKASKDPIQPAGQLGNISKEMHCISEAITKLDANQDRLDRLG